MDLVISTVSQGLLWALLAIGVYLTFRVLDIADLTVEGSFPLGAATAATLLTAGYHPIAAILAACAAGMLGGVVNMVPAARVGHVGLYRDPETLKPVEYYCKLPSDVAERMLIVVDPMLVTGGSSSAALTLLKEKGAKSIALMCLVAAPEGIRLVNEEHPDVPIYVAAVDDHLNEKGYIVPGLGDAGDRIFGTL